MGENIRNGVQTVGTSAVTVLPTLMRGQRTALTITNTSTAGQVISLSWGDEPVAGQSIVLYPGGSWSESRDAIFIPSNQQVWAIASAASATIAIHERIKAGGP